MENAPCKDCKDRWVDNKTCSTCHSTCEKYLDFRAKKDYHNQRRREELNSQYRFFSKNSKGERIFFWR